MTFEGLNAEQTNETPTTFQTQLPLLETTTALSPSLPATGQVDNEKKTNNGMLWGTVIMVEACSIL